ncbi:SUMO1 sentrin specific peptidase 8, variant 2 [Dermatophagoides farinae]|uniref:SUMO1 sentrin specific peptidase 8, variant 2 n=1 Tax=Dermatophagoides farinae TaxID=6954 RepID=A0A922HSJ3_DERFA|nr:SUMO1 sentrin specific peptidase 8, variant 2 [Dermatophagoides farinae]
MCDDDWQIVLSYHDAIIRQSDYRILQSRQWINDKYSNQLLCLSPSLTQLIKMTDSMDEIQAILQPLEIQQRKLILIPMNDNLSYDYGGSHWSLLVFINDDGDDQSRLEYYDSANQEQHKEMMINIKIIGSKLSQLLSCDPDIHFKQCHPQEDGYNCGIHLICNSNAICQKYLNNDQRSITTIITNEQIRSFRIELIDIIDRLKSK